MRSALTATSLSVIDPGSIWTVSGNVALSRGIDCLAKLIIETSSLHPATEGIVRENRPSVFEEENFFIFPSFPFIITDAPVNGSFASLSTTMPVTFTWACAYAAVRRQIV